jgi:hypothetical protein
MSRQFPRVAPFAAVLVAALVLVPTAASGTYADSSGDSGSAGDVTGVSVVGDKTSGQLVFRISGTNIASSETSLLFLSIDSDSNPLTGDLTDHGTDYWFGMDNQTYSFERWNGADWVRAPNSTVRINGSSSEIMVSVNRSELGNTAAFNFAARTWVVPINGASGSDDAPNDGMFNYSFDANGPRIDSVDVQTKPSVGPRAGKKFVLIPTGLHLPADGRTIAAMPVPESYTCKAKLGSRTLAGSGTGGCTFSIPKKKSKGKRLIVQLTVNYEGAVKTLPLTFRVT